MDGDGKHIGGQGLWGHCNSKCPTDLSKNIFGFVILNLKLNIAILQLIFTHIFNFIYSNEDGIDPGSNNTPRPPITGKRTSIFFYFISLNFCIPFMPNIEFSFLFLFM